MTWLPSFLIASLVSLLTLVILYPQAPRIGLMDHPGERRRIHRQAVPRIGGLALFAGLLVGTLLTLTPSASLLYGLSGAALLVLVGALDDCFQLGAKRRLLAQAGAALLLTLGGGVRLSSLGDLLGMGPLDLGPLALPFTLFAIVGVINAINMIDGIDGLAGGLVAIALISLLLLTPLPPGLSFLLLSCLAALVPVLVCNLELFGCHHRKVFLGDAGSMLLGYLLAWAMITTAETPGGITPVTALWLVAIPLTDSLRIMVRRLLMGRSPFSADRGHLHHVLARCLHSTRLTLLVMLALASLLAGLGSAGFLLALPEPIMFFAAMLLAGVYVLALGSVRRWYRRALAARGPMLFPCAQVNED